MDIRLQDGMAHASLPIYFIHVIELAGLMFHESLCPYGLENIVSLHFSPVSSDSDDMTDGYCSM